MVEIDYSLLKTCWEHIPTAIFNDLAYIYDKEENIIGERCLLERKNKTKLDGITIYLCFGTEGNCTYQELCDMDLGIKNLCNGVDNLGNVVTIPNKAKKINCYFRKQISKVQSKMDKCVKGSNKHEKLKKVKKKLYKRKDAQIKQTLHIQSKKLVNMNYKTIVVGDLSVKKLMEKGSNKLTKTSRSFSESAIATFMEFLTYKCQARNTEVETINEKWTTQQNCLT